MLKEEMIQMNSLLTKFTFTDELTDVIENCKGVFVPTSKAELYDMVFGPEHADVYDVVFDVPGKGQIKEADVVRCKNGASVNFVEDYMRRREPDCMRIADDKPTDKKRFADVYGYKFDKLRRETMDWFTDVLAESGIDFRHEIDEKHEGDNYEVLDVGHSTQYGEEYSEQLTMDAVLKHAEADGLEVQYEITMVKLEKDGDRVTGLIAKNANDEYVRYNASKGVILACGGYSGNETMMNALQPQSVEQTCVNYSKPGAKGDGIKACLWAGAIMDTTHTSMIFDRGAIKPDQTGEYGKASDGALFWMGSQPFLKVNLKGERFMNEYMPYDLVLHAAASQPYHTYCTVWDSKYAEDCEHFATHGCSRLYPHVNGTNPVFPMDYVQAMNADLQDQGYIVEADTIEELADKLGLPKETFTATVDHYNELAAKGEDEDYGKENYRLSTLSEAPFYGVRQAGGYLICTIDGIQIDDNMHAIDQDFKAIPGLYVIGDMSGNYFSGSYPSLMAGAAAGRSATFGRLAGQNAAAGI